MRAPRRLSLLTGTVVLTLLGGAVAAVPAEAAPAAAVTATAVALPTKVAVKTLPGAVDLAWHASRTEAVAGYSVRFRAKGAAAWSAARTTASSPVHLAGLTNGTRYELAVRAETAAASSAWTAPVSGVPGARPGVVPALRVVRYSSSDTEVAWSRPADAGGRTITGYDLRFRTAATAAWHGFRRSASQTATMPTRVGASAQVQVRAVTSRGTGAWSAPTSPLPSAAVAAPSSFSAAGARGAVRLRWAAVPGATGYLVRWRAPRSAVWTSTVVAGSRATETSLRAGLRYRFAVAALTASGIGRSAEDTAAPGRVPVTAPRSPRVVSGAGSATVTWSRPAEGAPKVYEVRYRASGSIAARTLRTTKRTVVLRGLQDGATYSVNVRGVAKHRGSWSMTVQASPAARPAAPAALIAKLESATSSLDLTWTAAAAGPTAAAYDVRYRAKNATAWTTVRTVGAGPTLSLPGLAGGSSYALQVRGRTAVGGGAWSAPTTAYVPAFSLPVVDIATSAGAPIVNTEDYVASTVSIASKSDPTQDFTGTAGVKGHGNSTWPLPKKPYKIKLDAKASLLGMATNKHWVLLADAKDRSHLRNDVALYLGKQTGLAWTPDSRFVELVLNGQYEGLYELAEQVRIDTDRVNIDSLTSKDTSPAKITGGYLLERDGNRDAATEAGFTTAAGEPITIKDPEVPTAAQEAYIHGYVDTFESALYSGGDYQQYIDVDSFVDWYIVEELVENSDAWFSSAYLVKPRGGKLAMGPLWDFDLSTMDSGVTKGKATSWYVKDLGWWSHLTSDPAFAKRVTERWQVLKPQFDTVWARIAAQRASIATAAAQDEQLWGYTTHDHHVDAMSAFLRTREAWLNSQWTTPTPTPAR